MEPKQIAKQMAEFSKTAFDHSFEAMAAIQDQTAKMVAAMFVQTSFVPADGKKFINQWMNICMKSREEFKAAADKNFSKFFVDRQNPDQDQKH